MNASHITASAARAPYPKWPRRGIPCAAACAPQRLTFPILFTDIQALSAFGQANKATK